MAPVPAPSSHAPTYSDFSSDQRLRIDRLREALEEARSPAVAGGLWVRLAFDDAADLDLFVTDPLQESLYFANSPTRIGGRLLDDRRCDDPSPRVETAHYANPITGRYRVGVDFHRRCRGTSLSNEDEKQGFYVIRVDEGAHTLEHVGMLTPGQFEVISIEFDVER